MLNTLTKKLARLTINRSSSVFTGLATTSKASSTTQLFSSTLLPIQSFPKSLCPNYSQSKRSLNTSSDNKLSKPFDLSLKDLKVEHFGSTSLCYKDNLKLTKRSTRQTIFREDCLVLCNPVTQTIVGAIKFESNANGHYITHIELTEGYTDKKYGQILTLNVILLALKSNNDILLAPEFDQCYLHIFRNYCSGLRSNSPFEPQKYYGIIINLDDEESRIQFCARLETVSELGRDLSDQFKIACEGLHERLERRKSVGII